MVDQVDHAVAGEEEATVDVEVTERPIHLVVVAIVEATEVAAGAMHHIEGLAGTGRAHRVSLTGHLLRQGHVLRTTYWRLAIAVLC